jgi:stage V sporulation protein K
LKNKRNPISLIEDSFSSLKGYLESELNNNKMPLTSVLINELEQEAKRILKLCDDLNKDDDFIAVLNSELRHHGSNGLLLKAEHFFISDLITVYQSSRGKQTDVSGFVLAYYYDAIRNNHFADSKAIGTLNKLAASDEFKAHLAKIEKDNVLRPADAQIKG